MVCINGNKQNNNKNNNYSYFLSSIIIKIKSMDKTKNINMKNIKMCSMLIKPLK